MRLVKPTPRAWWQAASARRVAARARRAFFMGAPAADLLATRTIRPDLATGNLPARGAARTGCAGRGAPSPSTETARAPGRTRALARFTGTAAAFRRDDAL